VEILKTPLKEVSGEDSYLENLIKAIIKNNPQANQANQNNQNFKMGPIERKKNGLRICKVNIVNLDTMNLLAN
jgi:hypothetical protein